MRVGEILFPVPYSQFNIKYDCFVSQLNPNPPQFLHLLIWSLISGRSFPQLAQREEASREYRVHQWGTLSWSVGQVYKIYTVCLIATCFTDKGHHHSWELSIFRHLYHCNTHLYTHKHTDVKHIFPDITILILASLLLGVTYTEDTCSDVNTQSRPACSWEPNKLRWTELKQIFSSCKRGLRFLKHCYVLWLEAFLEGCKWMLLNDLDWTFVICCKWDKCIYE